MPILYKCNECGKQYKHKNDYKKHLSRKKPCNNISRDIKTPPKINLLFECTECNQTFISKHNLDKHLLYSCPYKIALKNSSLIFNLNSETLNDDSINDLTTLNNTKISISKENGKKNKNIPPKNIIGKKNTIIPPINLINEKKIPHPQ